VRSLGFDTVANSHLLPGHLLVSGDPGKLQALAAADEIAYILPAAHDLVAGHPLLACGGRFTEAGPPVAEFVPYLTGPRNGSLRFASEGSSSLLPGNPPRAEIWRAFQEWQKYAGLTLAREDGANGGENITIRILGDDAIFEVAGGAPAHTLFPSAGGAEIHFHLEQQLDADLFAAALHQVGHALGLGHSSDPADLMYPYYGRTAGLSSGDIAALRAMRGRSPRPTALGKVKSEVPDMTVAVAHSGCFKPGQMGATYVATASNSGNGPTTGAVTVTDVFPPGLSGASIAGSGWSCLQPAGPCTRNNALAAGASYPAITVTVNVATNAAAGVTNIVKVSGGGETITSNDQASDPTTITLTPPVYWLPISPSSWNMTGTWYKGSLHPATTASDGGIVLTFPQASTGSFIGYFTAPQPAKTSISGSTLSMTLKVTTTGSPVFDYNSEAINTCVTPATVRPFFWGALNPNANESRWWSNPIAYVLGPGTVTLTVPLTGDHWMDVDGHYGNDSVGQPGFLASLANVGSIGMTFGGGCFLGHGVNVSGGTATFELVSYRIY
jgi:hypothetical protein